MVFSILPVLFSGLSGCKPRSDVESSEDKSDSFDVNNLKATWYTQGLSVPAHKRFPNSLQSKPLGRYITHSLELDYASFIRPAVFADGKSLVTVGVTGKLIWLLNVSHSAAVGELPDFYSGFKLPNGELTASSPAILSNGIVVTTGPNSIYWLDGGTRVNAKIVYKCELSSSNFPSGFSSPAILSDNTVVVGSLDHKIYWAKAGQKLFEFETGEKVTSSPAVLSDNSIVVGSHDGKIYWLNDGQKSFEFQANGAIVTSPAVLNDDTVVISSDEKKVYWLKNGEMLFEFQTSDDFLTSAAVLDDGTVVLAGNILADKSSTVYWLRNGQKLFEYKNNGLLYGPVAVLAEGVVAINGSDASVSELGSYVRWLKNGKKLIDLSLHRFRNSDDSPIAVLADGTLAIHSLAAGIVYIK